MKQLEKVWWALYISWVSQRWVHTQQRPERSQAAHTSLVKGACARVQRECKRDWQKAKSGVGLKRAWSLYSWVHTHNHKQREGFLAQGFWAQPLTNLWLNTKLYRHRTTPRKPGLKIKARKKRNLVNTPEATFSMEDRFYGFSPGINKHINKAITIQG